MKFLSIFVGIACGFICFLLLPQAAFAQDFSSLDSDLQQLEDLINDTINNTNEQQKLLDSLKESLDESGNLIANYESTIIEQETLLKDLQARLNEMSETFKMQSALSARYEQRLKSWKIFTLIAIPASALISGSIVSAIAH